MNCPKCQEENDLDCESRCWKCGEKLSHGRSASSCSDPWYEMLCELDEIREHLAHHGMPKWSATIGDVQSRLTKQKETIKTLDQNRQNTNSREDGNKES